MPKPVVAAPVKSSFEMPKLEDAPTGQKNTRYVNKMDKMLQRL